MTSLRAWTLPLVGALVVTFASYSGKQWNFDLLGYAAVVEHWKGASGEALHHAVYEEVRAVAPEAQFTALTASSGYRKGLFAEPDQLERQLAFYVNKPLYPALAGVLSALGMNVVLALFVVSALSLGVFALLWVRWLALVVPGGAAMGGVLILLAPPLLEAGQLATPDALCAALVLGGAMALHTQRLRLAWVLLALGCLTRPDAVLWGVALLVASTGVSRSTAQGLGIIGAVTLISQGLLHGASWSALFVHTFVHRVVTVDDFATAHVDWSTYVDTLRRGSLNDFVLHPAGWLVFVGLAVFARTRALIPVGIATVLHFALFPMWADRFLLVPYALVVLAVLERPRLEAKVKA